MTRAELLALAERVEASAPDRELDAEIARLCGAIIPWHHIGRDVAEWHDPKGVLTGSMTTSGRYVPRYMSSIDAAALLMPPGWLVVIHTGLGGSGQEAQAVANYGRMEVRGHAKDEPRARLAAALRALAEETQHEKA